jgi:hypothetical protein
MTVVVVMMVILLYDVGSNGNYDEDVYDGASGGDDNGDMMVVVLQCVFNDVPIFYNSITVVCTHIKMMSTSLYSPGYYRGITRVLQQF